MFRYAIVEISGRQYKVSPKEELLVDHLGDIKKLECDKVLLVAEGDSVKVGDPYLKEKLVFEVLGSEKGSKLRVFKYHAKANYRKTRGFRAMHSKITLSA